MIERSQVRLPADTLLGSNSGQVVHTHVPLSPSSIIWYRSKRREGNGSRWERCGREAEMSTGPKVAER